MTAHVTAAQAAVVARLTQIFMTPIFTRVTLEIDAASFHSGIKPVTNSSRRRDL
ncbi:hypothetical protein ACLTEW_17595 [Gordonia lacunae]|uniref:hypothetical protein n=1 Tax=Gordonia lacunae TaxID=417102 RepID=UPI0039E32C52